MCQIVDGLIIQESCQLGWQLLASSSLMFPKVSKYGTMQKVAALTNKGYIRFYQLMIVFFWMNF